MTVAHTHQSNGGFLTKFTGSLLVEKGSGSRLRRRFQATPFFGVLGSEKASVDQPDR
jgi:hypothetical protein